MDTHEKKKQSFADVQSFNMKLVDTSRLATTNDKMDGNLIYLISIC